METNTSLYFAYGSNVNVEQMRRRIPDARVVGRAVLKGWRVVERQIGRASCRERVYDHV